MNAPGQNNVLSDKNTHAKSWKVWPRYLFIIGQAGVNKDLFWSVWKTRCQWIKGMKYTIIPCIVFMMIPYQEDPGE